MNFSERKKVFTEAAGVHTGIPALLVSACELEFQLSYFVLRSRNRSLAWVSKAISFVKRTWRTAQGVQQPAVLVNGEASEQKIVEGLPIGRYCHVALGAFYASQLDLLEVAP